MRASRASRPLLIVAGILVVLLIVGGIGLLAVWHPWTSNNLSFDLTASFVVKPTDVLPEDAKCTDSKASDANINGPFLYSDSVSSKFKSRDADTPAATFTELRKAVCTEVGTGYAAAKMLDSKWASIDGKTLGELNPWLGEMITKGKEGLAKAFWTKNILAQRIETTEEYRTYAAMINTLLMRFPAPDIAQSDWSIANWHVPNVKHFAVSTQKVVIPVAVLNKDYQENKPAIWFTARDKGDVCHLVIGFNLGDKRPEVGKCENKPPRHPPTTPPSGPPSHPPTNPPKDKCPPGYVGKPPKCLESKKANQDPAQNGNAGNGGGKNQDPGPGPTTTPTTVPSAPRTNPPPPPAPEPTREDPPPPKEKPTDPPKTGDPGGF